MSTQPSASSRMPDEIVRDRRTVLRSAAAIGLAGAATPLLAACGDDGAAAGGGATTPASSAPSSAPTSSAPAETSAPATSAPSSAGGGGPVLGPTSDVPVGGGKVYKDAKIVVTQPTAGQYKGFSAVCTHMSCVLADVAGGTINCGCHGSKFNVADGTVARGPASSQLAAADITVHGNQIHGPA